MTKPLRKVWRYIPVLCEMSELKKGDLFQMRKASPEDEIEEDILLIARADAIPCTDNGSTHSVDAGEMIPHGHAPRLVVK